MLKKIFMPALCIFALLLVGCDNNSTSSQSDAPAAAETATVDFEKVRNMTLAEEEEAMKKEPAYGQVHKIGYNGGVCLGTFGIAHLKGFYEAEGLQIEVVKMQMAQDAIATGKVVAAGDHIATMTVPTVNGLNIVFTGNVHSGCKTLYVLASSGIKSTADLIGKNVGIHDGIGASDHNIGLRFLIRDNISPADVKFKMVEGGASILAMQNGEVDGAILSDQFAKPFMDDGLIIPIRSLTFDDDFKKEVCCIHAMNKTFVEQNPVIAKKLTRAHAAAAEWIQNNKPEAVDVLKAGNWASGERGLVIEMFESWTFGLTNAETETTLRNVIKDYQTVGLISKDLDSEKVLKNIWLPLLP